MSKKENTLAIHADPSVREVSERIYTLRGRQVMLDSDLAEIYNVETRILKRAVRSNFERFPDDDFMFEPTKDELENLRSRIWISSLENRENADARPNLRSKFWISSSLDGSGAHGGGRYKPFVFTEPGVAMLSGVLHSERAINMNIAIMKAFIQLRKRMDTDQIDLVSKIDGLGKSVAELKHQLAQVVIASKAKQSTCSLDRKTGLPRFARNDDHVLGRFGKRCKLGLPEEARVRAIQVTVARHWGLSVEDLKSSGRKRAISLARQIAIFLIRKHMSMPFAEIGQHFGQRDHTTILHAYRKIHADSDDNNLIRRALTSLQKEIQPLT